MALWEVTALDEGDGRVERGPHATAASVRIVSSGMCLNRCYDGVVVAAEAMECWVWAIRPRAWIGERGE